MVLFMYSTLKFTHLASKHNPNISSFDKVDHYNDQFINLNARNFRIAITFEDYLSPIKQKSDSRYVKYLFRIYGKRKGIEFQKILPYHVCTDEDYDEFYPTKKQSLLLLQSIREDPDRGMFCIDWDDDDPIELINHEQDYDYARIDVIVTPCNYVHTMLGYEGDSISDECIGDF